MTTLIDRKIQPKITKLTSIPLEPVKINAPKSVKWHNSRVFAWTLLFFGVLLGMYSCTDNKPINLMPITPVNLAPSTQGSAVNSYLGAAKQGVVALKGHIDVPGTPLLTQVGSNIDDASTAQSAESVAQVKSDQAYQTTIDNNKKIYETTIDNNKKLADTAQTKLEAENAKLTSDLSSKSYGLGITFLIFGGIGFVIGVGLLIMSLESTVLGTLMKGISISVAGAGIAASGFGIFMISVVPYTIFMGLAICIVACGLIILTGVLVGYEIYMHRAALSQVVATTETLAQLAPESASNAVFGVGAVPGHATTLQSATTTKMVKAIKASGTIALATPVTSSTLTTSSTTAATA